MSDNADLAFAVTALIERPTPAGENNYIVARVHRGKTTLHDLRCTAQQRQAQMRKQFGINTAEHRTWAVGQVVNGQLYLCGPSAVARDAIKAKHPNLRVVS